MTTNPMMKPSGVRLVIIVSAIALAITGLGFLLLTNSPGSKSKPTETTSQNRDKSPVGGIGALGRLEPEGEVFRVAPPAVGFNSRILQMRVREGDQVKANQVVAVLDSAPSLQAAVLVAQSEAAAAEAQLNQAKAGAKVTDVGAQRAAVAQQQVAVQQAVDSANEANLDYRNAQINARRLQSELGKAEWELVSFGELCVGQRLPVPKLSQRLRAFRKTAATPTVCANGAVSEQALRTKLDDYVVQRELYTQAQGAVAQAKVRVDRLAKEITKARATVAQNSLQVQSLQKPRAVDVRQAEAQFNVARANLRKAQIDFENATVKSPLDGRVLKIHAKPGEVISNDGVMEIGRTSQMYAVAEVDENLVGRVKPGQVASVKSDAFEGEITGRVVKVGSKVGKNAINSTDPADNQDSRVVEVKIKLDDSERVAGLTNLQVRVKILPAT